MLLFLAATVIFLSVAVSRLASRLKVPMLLGFIFLGLFVGNDIGIGPEFANYSLTESICTAALVVVMFDGGFQTRWKTARHAAWRAGLLASLGVVITALATGAFCHYVLHMSWLQGLLLGSLVSSTDAASVFSILRSRNLSLKDHTDSLLELESGSNDPVSYLMVTLILTLLEKPVTPEEISVILVTQIGLGILGGWLVSRFALWFLKRVPLDIAGFLTVFVLGCALMAYAGPALLSGNGYLAVYLCGLILGNTRLQHKKELVHFFDGLSALMQMAIFFMLGLLADPQAIWQVLPVSLAVFLFLTFVARPAAVFAILAGFRSSLSQMLLVSAAGLRGAASIVFAIMAMVSGVPFGMDVFHIVFGIVLFSISLQGSLLPWLAEKLKMSDASGNILKTFSDYSELPDLQFSLLELQPGARWHGRRLSDIALPSGMAVAMVLRGNQRLAPDGDTMLQELDRLVVTSQPYESGRSLLDSEVLEAGDPRIGQSLLAVHGDPIVCIARDSRMIVPEGSTILEEGDALVFVERKT